MISALRPGLAMKATTICLYRTTTHEAAQDQEHQHPDQEDPG